MRPFVGHRHFEVQRQPPGAEASGLSQFGATIGRGEYSQLVDRVLSSRGDLSSSLSDRLSPTSAVGQDLDGNSGRDSRVNRLEAGRSVAVRTTPASKRLAIGTGKPRVALTHDEAIDAVIAELEQTEDADQTPIRVKAANRLADLP